MYKLTAIVLLAFTVYYIQSLPTQNSEAYANAGSEEKLQFYTNDETNMENYHLTPVLRELETEDQQIEAELNAILPYLNFLVGSDKGVDGEKDCFDQLEVQVVPDN